MINLVMIQVLKLKFQKVITCQQGDSYANNIRVYIIFKKYYLTRVEKVW